MARRMERELAIEPRPGSYGIASWRVRPTKRRRAIEPLDCRLPAAGLQSEASVTHPAACMEAIENLRPRARAVRRSRRRSIGKSAATATATAPARASSTLTGGNRRKQAEKCPSRSRGTCGPRAGPIDRAADRSAHRCIARGDGVGSGADREPGMHVDVETA